MIEAIFTIALYAVGFIAFFFWGKRVGENSVWDIVNGDPVYDFFDDEDDWDTFDEDEEDFCPFLPDDVVILKGTKVKDVVVSVPGMADYDEAEYSDAKQGFKLKETGWDYFDQWELAPEKPVVKAVPKKKVAKKKTAKKKK